MSTSPLNNNNYNSGTTPYGNSTMQLQQLALTLQQSGVSNYPEGQALMQQLQARIQNSALNPVTGEEYSYFQNQAILMFAESNAYSAQQQFGGHEELINNIRKMRQGLSDSA